MRGKGWNCWALRVSLGLRAGLKVARILPSLACEYLSGGRDVERGGKIPSAADDVGFGYYEKCA